MEARSLEGGAPPQSTPRQYDEGVEARRDSAGRAQAHRRRHNITGEKG